MSMLQVWSVRCIHRHKFSTLSSLIQRNHKSSHSLLQVYTQRKRTLFVTSSRSFSWQDFYTSIALSTPVSAMQNFLLELHSYSGLPWWAVIFLSTLGIRSFIVFPLALHQNQVIARIANLNAELAKLAPELNKEVNIAAKMYGWNEISARKIFRKNMREIYQKLILRDNCHPFKIVLLALFQIPAWICFSISLRNLTMFGKELCPDAVSLQQDLKMEGTLWFPDLTVPDMFILPILLTAVNLFLIEIHAARQIGKGSKLQNVILIVMRLIVLMVGGAAALNPASVSFYWLCSSTFGVAQSLMFMSPRFRRFFRIPRTANESATPFKDISSNLRKRYFS